MSVFDKFIGIQTQLNAIKGLIGSTSLVERSRATCAVGIGQIKRTIGHMAARIGQINGTIGQMGRGIGRMREVIGIQRYL